LLWGWVLISARRSINSCRNAVIDYYALANYSPRAPIYHFCSILLEEQLLALNFGAHMTHFDLGRTLTLFSNVLRH
jgi:hypothetical protein